MLKMKPTIKVVLVVFSLMVMYDSIGPFERSRGIELGTKGELLVEKSSPDQQYIFRLYALDGDATVAFSRIGEVEYIKEKKTKNVYYKYRDDKNNVSWKSHNVVQVNGITLDVEKDVYNSTRGIYNFIKGY